MNFIDVEEMENIPSEKMKKLYKDHCNPAFQKILKYSDTDIDFARACGMHVYDKLGNEYLDFVGGFGALNIGHNDERVLKAMNNFSYKPNLLQIAERPAEAILANDISFLTKDEFPYCVFTNSGTETVEEAIKLSLLYNKGGNIIYFSKAYHGKTIGSLSALGSKSKESYDPLMYNFIEVPYGDIEAIKKVVQDANVAAILAEPIQGEGGIVIPPENFFKQVRKICDKEDIVLIMDEIQTGLGRCGSMFFYEQLGILPDIICLSKSLSGGYMPIGCMCVEPILWEETYGKMKNATLISNTFGGNNLACVAAIKTLSIIQEEQLDKKAYDLGIYALGLLTQVKNRHKNIIKAVRGRGLMIGIEFNNLKGVIPDKTMELMMATVISKMMNEYKIITSYTSNNPAVLRVEPPLIVTKEQINYFIESFDNVLNEEGSLFKLGLCSVKSIGRNVYTN